MRQSAVFVRSMPGLVQAVCRVGVPAVAHELPEDQRGMLQNEPALAGPEHVTQLIEPSPQRRLQVRGVCRVRGVLSDGDGWSVQARFNDGFGFARQRGNRLFVPVRWRNNGRVQAFRPVAGLLVIDTAAPRAPPCGLAAPAYT